MTLQARHCRRRAPFTRVGRRLFSTATNCVTCQFLRKLSLAACQRNVPPLQPLSPWTRHLWIMIPCPFPTLSIPSRLALFCLIISLDCLCLVLFLGFSCTPSKEEERRQFLFGNRLETKALLNSTKTTIACMKNSPYSTAVDGRASTPMHQAMCTCPTAHLQSTYMWQPHFITDESREETHNFRTSGERTPSKQAADKKKATAPPPPSYTGFPPTQEVCVLCAFSAVSHRKILRRRSGRTSALHVLGEHQGKVRRLMHEALWPSDHVFGRDRSRGVPWIPRQSLRRRARKSDLVRSSRYLDNQFGVSAAGRWEDCCPRPISSAREPHVSVQARGGSCSSI